MLIATVLASMFATSPDLCADVYLDSTGAPITDAWGQTLARYCQWAGPDAPELDAEVCCTIDGDGAHCSVPDVNGRCAIGFKMFCAYGEVIGEGVTCYQPFPSACDHGFCGEGIDAPTQTSPDLMCCFEQGCEEIKADQLFPCSDSGGYLLWCNDGVTNEDGTAECFDEPG